MRPGQHKGNQEDIPALREEELFQRNQQYPLHPPLRHLQFLHHLRHQN